MCLFYFILFIYFFQVEEKGIENGNYKELINLTAAQKNRLEIIFYKIRMYYLTKKWKLLIDLF